MEDSQFHRGWTTVTEGEFAGWMNWPGDAWEMNGGPFYFRRDDAGQVTCAFRAQAKHMNGQGHMHGGAMMTFADFALFGIGAATLGEGSAVTVSMNSEFVRGAEIGDLMEATGEVIKAGKRLIFIKGEIRTGGQVVLNFSGMLMRVPRS